MPLNVMDYETSLRLMVQLNKLIRRPRVSKDLREEIESGLNLASVTKAYFEDLGYSEPAWYTEMMSGFSPVAKVKSGTAKRDEKEKVVRRSPRRRGPAPVILKSGRIARG